MADNPSSADITSQINGVSPQPGASATISTPSTANSPQPTDAKQQDNPLSDDDNQRSTRKKPRRNWIYDSRESLKTVFRWQYVAVLATLLITVFLVLSQSEPWGTWGAVITAAIALVVVVYIAGRVLRSQYFWGGLVIFAVLVYAASLAYQAGAPGRALQRQAWTTRSVTVGSSQHDLVVSYPSQAPFQASDQPGLPLFIYFDGANAAPTINTTTAISFTLTFLPENQGLVFTDEKGVPVLPQLAVRTGEQSSQSAALYVRSALTSTQPATITVALAARPNSTGTAWQAMNPVVVSTESSFNAWWRRFLGLLLGPATPILALVGTLLGFGWQWWQSERERRAKHAAVVARFCQLTTVDPNAAALQYRETLATAVSEKWPDDIYSDLHNCLKKLAERREQILLDCLRVLQEERLKDCENLLWVVAETDKLTGKTSQGSVRLAVEMMLAYARNKDELWPFVKNRVAVACEALFSSFRQFGHLAPSLWIGPLADLAGRPESISEFIKQIEKDESTRRRLVVKKEIGEALERLTNSDEAPKHAREAAKSLLTLSDTPRPWLRCHLWSRGGSEEPDRVKKWLDEMQLAFNPFGPESAEYDARLPDYVVDSVFADARGKRAALVAAAPGAGRTAAALSIARDCDNPLPSPRESVSFPVYYTPPIPSKGGNDANDHVQAIGTAASRWLMKLIASKPHVFLDAMSKSRQVGLVYLLKASLGSMSEVGYALHRSGKSDVDRVLREMQAIDAGSARIRRISQDELPEVLVGALPDPYECVYLLADVRTPQSKEREAVLADALAPLVEMAMPLAANDVYLKVFAPMTIMSNIATPTGCVRTALLWNESVLKDMLKARVTYKDRSEEGFRGIFDLLFIADDPADRLVAACVAHEDAPRHLIRLGNALLRKHAEQDGDKKIALSTLEAVLVEAQ